MSSARSLAFSVRSRAFTRARPAPWISARRPQRVVRRELVAVLAVSASMRSRGLVEVATLANRIADIVNLSAEKKVVRPDTRPVVAVVADDCASRYRTMGERKGIAMSIPCSPTFPHVRLNEGAVAARLSRANPDPTVLRLFDAAPEPLSGRGHIVGTPSFRAKHSCCAHPSI